MVINVPVTQVLSKRGVVTTMVVGVVAFIVLITITVTSSNKSTDPKDLKLVHIIFRHGYRTPADTYPNDPYINETFYPTGWGQITEAGKIQMFELGKWLRKRYDDFLGKFYFPEEYYVETTDADRTKVSAQLINAGLWPPSGIQKWGDLNWQPIPIHSVPLSIDNLLLVRRPCAQYNLELERLLKEDVKVKQMLEKYQNLFRELTEITGKEIHNFDDAQDVYSTLIAEDNLNLSLPNWTKDYYPDVLLPPTIFSFVLNAYNSKLQRLKGGVLLKKLISDWNSTRENGQTSNKIKAILYGGHDSTISNLLSALKVFDPQVPEYGITVLLEFSLNKNTNDFELEIFLKNSTENLHKLIIPGCESLCPLDNVIELTKDVIPENWEAECSTDDPNYVPPPPGPP